MLGRIVACGVDSGLGIICSHPFNNYRDVDANALPKHHLWPTATIPTNTTVHPGALNTATRSTLLIVLFDELKQLIHSGNATAQLGAKLKELEVWWHPFLELTNMVHPKSNHSW